MKRHISKLTQQLIRPMRFRHAECAIQFWHHPPILPGLTYIDNLSLYLTP